MAPYHSSIFKISLLLSIYLPSSCQLLLILINQIYVQFQHQHYDNLPPSGKLPSFCLSVFSFRLSVGGVSLVFWSVFGQWPRTGTMTYSTTTYGQTLFAFFLLHPITRCLPAGSAALGLLTLRPSQLTVRYPQLPLRPSQLYLRPSQLPLRLSQLPLWPL